MSDPVEPFEIRVDDATLDDLRERLARTRVPDQIEGTGWEYGFPSDYLAAQLVDSVVAWSLAALVLGLVLRKR